MGAPILRPEGRAAIYAKETVHIDGLDQGRAVLRRNARSMDAAPATAESSSRGWSSRERQ
jgi:hypothetical protein